MQQAKFKVKAAGSYGKRGDIVVLDTDKLTDRQKVMLEPYVEPSVKDLTEEKKPTAKATK